jgi:hypothetical protein
MFSVHPWDKCFCARKNWGRFFEVYASDDEIGYLLVAAFHGSLRSYGLDLYQYATQNGAKRVSAFLEQVSA